MNSSASSAGACPASAIVMAARMARTPLAIAEAGMPDAAIMFVNDAFAQLLDSEASSWVGRPLSALAAPASPLFPTGETTRFEAAIGGGRRLPLALSIATVAGPRAEPLCLLCSLVDARGEGAAEAIERDAGMLAQVARAAGDLMGEAALAARSPIAAGDDARASEIALAAVRRAVHPSAGDAA